MARGLVRARCKQHQGCGLDSCIIHSTYAEHVSLTVSVDSSLSCFGYKCLLNEHIIFKVRKVSERSQQYGSLIDERVHMNVAVIVAGDSLVNLKCSLLLESSPSVDSRRFVGMATQLEYEAKAHIAQKLSVKTAGNK